MSLTSNIQNSEYYIEHPEFIGQCFDIDHLEYIYNIIDSELGVRDIKVYKDRVARRIAEIEAPHYYLLNDYPSDRIIDYYHYRHLIRAVQSDLPILDIMDFSRQLKRCCIFQTNWNVSTLWRLPYHTSFILQTYKFWNVDMFGIGIFHSGIEHAYYRMKYCTKEIQYHVNKTLVDLLPKDIRGILRDYVI